jgi:hypothetical protein
VRRIQTFHEREFRVSATAEIEKAFPEEGRRIQSDVASIVTLNSRFPAIPNSSP